MSGHSIIVSGSLKWSSGQSKDWKGASGVGVAPGEAKSRQAESRASPENNVSAAFSPELHFHKHITLNALSRSWNVSVAGNTCQANRTPLTSTSELA